MLFYLVILGYGVGLGGEVIDIFFYFVLGVVYLIFFVVLGFGGVFYLLIGLEILEEFFLFFGYVWKDKNKMIIILGIYLIVLGVGVWLLVLKVMYIGGIYDIWVLGGGDFCIIINLIINLGVIFSYFLKFFFGGDGWIVSVDNNEDIIGGYIWIGIFDILGGIWYIFIKLWVWVRCVFVWFGEVYFLYSLVVIVVMGFVVCVMFWFNNIVYLSEFYGLIGFEVF